MEEHEMCQNCKKDIPLNNYRSHTLHCARAVNRCSDCNELVSRAEMEAHFAKLHAIKVCDLCGVKVAAAKFQDHRSALCPQLPLSCKLCGCEQPAALMSDHEAACGSRPEFCAKCEVPVPLRDWDKHQAEEHGITIVHRSPCRQRKKAPTSPAAAEEGESSAMRSVSAAVAAAAAADTSTMLPCEFCEGLVPIYKLLEHQAECVNPTNVRGSASLRRQNHLHHLQHHNGQQQVHHSFQRSQAIVPPTKGIGDPGGSRPATAAGYGLTRSTSSSRLSNYGSLTRGNYYYNREEVQSPIGDENNYGNQVEPVHNVLAATCTTHLLPFRNSRGVSISRASSVREARATTEERTLQTVYRQSSFNERSYRRRAESLSRQSSFSRTGSSRYSSAQYSSDYVSAARRTSLFDGYSGFAIYSSISQGLDQISYGGRLSRRNSITENNYSRRGSVSAAPAADYSLPTLLATYEATKSTSSPEPASKSESSREVSRQNSYRQQEDVVEPHRATSSGGSTSHHHSYHHHHHSKEKAAVKVSKSQSVSEVKGAGAAVAAAGQKPKAKPKLCRRVSFTEKEPVVIDDTNSEDKSQSSGKESDEPRKPRRSKKETKEKKKKRRDRSQDDREKRKSQPLGEELFEQVSSKLRQVEIERQQQEHQSEVSSQQQHEQQQAPSPPPPPVAVGPPAPPAAAAETATVCFQNENAHPSCSSSSHVPIVNEVVLNSCGSEDMDMAFGESPSSSKGMTSSEASPPQKPKQNRNSGLWSSNHSDAISQNGNSEVKLRDGRTSESRASSKRNSLDSKTVAVLAQDLAAECAKAYALMESSLSKLSTEFGGVSAPFGITARTKKSRKPKS